MSITYVVKSRVEGVIREVARTQSIDRAMSLLAAERAHASEAAVFLDTILTGSK